MKATAQKKNARNTRTKIRLTGNELARLREIAKEHHMTEAALLRDATLGGPPDRITVLKRDDLQEMAVAISGLDETVGAILGCADKAGLSFLRESGEIDGNRKAIDRLYAELRKKVEGKRILIARKAAQLFLKQAGREVRGYREEGGKTEHAISLCVSEEEIGKIRDAAGREGCSISCLLKRNAFTRYSCRRITVDVDSLDTFLQKIRQKQRFLGAILKDVSTRRMEEDDLSSAAAILAQAVDEFKKQAEVVNNSPDAVRREARELMKQMIADSS